MPFLHNARDMIFRENVAREAPKGQKLQRRQQMCLEGCNRIRD
jgi:hypothetical protein